VAKRRKVGNLMALAILAALTQRPMHPYETASVLRTYGKDQDMKIKWGSLYSVVQSLAKHELIEPVESTRQGARPERTVYRITETGRQELKDWESELISTPEREHSRFKAALSVLSILSPEEVVSLLQRRADLLHEQITEGRKKLAEHLQHVPRLFLIEDEYEWTQLESELTWIRALLGELTTGTFPDLATWRDYHADTT
jgi:DNA-binding PadR family transcriptional regulator